MADTANKFFKEAMLNRCLNPNQKEFYFTRKNLKNLIHEAINVGEIEERKRAIPWIEACINNEIHGIIQQSINAGFDYVCNQFKNVYSLDDKLLAVKKISKKVYQEYRSKRRLSKKIKKS